MLNSIAKHFMPIMALLAVLAATSCQRPSATSDHATKLAAPQAAAKQQRLPDSVTLAFTGDIMLGSVYQRTYGVPEANAMHVFDDTRDLIRSVDLACGNLEGSVFDGTIKCRKGDGPMSFAFDMPTRLAPALKDAGFDYMNLANNHIYDFYDAGAQSTMRVLDSLGIAHSGYYKDKPWAIVERGGVKYGLMGFGQDYYTHARADTAQARRLIKELRPQVDVIVVAVHGGAEGSAHEHLPAGDESEMFQSEDRGHLRTFMHMLIDCGADVIYGHGPHVVRAMECYKGHLIAYSLGNFATPHGIGIAGLTGYAPLLTVAIDPSNGRFLGGKIHSFVQVTGKGPRRDPSCRPAQRIAMLTQADFGNPHLRIAPDGTVTPVK